MILSQLKNNKTITISDEQGLSLVAPYYEKLVI